MAPPLQEAKRDYYEVLGVKRDATQQEIKSKYRRLAMRLHPDKNPGDEDAKAQFQEVSVAYSVLSDSNKRRQYDVGGHEALGADFDSLSLDELGFGATLAVALFSKLGVQLPTAVNPKTLAAAQGEGRERAIELRLNAPPLQRRIDKQTGEFFKVTVSEEDVRSGFCIRAESPAGSRFKLLLLDDQGNISQQEESQKNPPGASGTAAYLFFCPFSNFTVDQSPLSASLLQAELQELQVPPLFRKLELFCESRLPRKLVAGTHYFGVYGDNYFNKVKYQVDVVRLNASVAKDIEQVENKLLTKKDELKVFEKEYLEAKERYEAAVARADKESQMIDEDLGKRRQLYERYLRS